MKERVCAQVEYVRFFLYTFTRKGIKPSTYQSKIQKGHGSQAMSLVTGRKETLCPFLKTVGRRTLGTADLSASPLCLGRSWNRSS